MIRGPALARVRYPVSVLPWQAIRRSAAADGWQAGGLGGGCHGNRCFCGAWMHGWRESPFRSRMNPCNAPSNR